MMSDQASYSRGLLSNVIVQCRLNRRYETFGSIQIVDDQNFHCIEKKPGQHFCNSYNCDLGRRLCLSFIGLYN